MHLRHSLRKLEVALHDSLQVEHTITNSARIVPASLNFEFDEELLSNLISVKECLKKGVILTVDIKVMTKDFAY